VTLDQTARQIDLRRTVALKAEPFGMLPDGSPVMRYTLSRPNGLTLRVRTYGGVVQSLEVPDPREAEDVVLGSPHCPSIWPPSTHTLGR
jgi:galactose mutarotase-like enzyme